MVRNENDGSSQMYSDEMRCIRLGVSGEIRPTTTVKKRASLRDEFGWNVDAYDASENQSN